MEVVVKGRAVVLATSLAHKQSGTFCSWTEIDLEIDRKTKGLKLWRLHTVDVDV